MNRDFCFYIEQICREKGLSREDVIKSLESALLSAAKKLIGTKRNVNLTIDPDSCEITITVRKKVVEVVKNPQTEISLQEAKALVPDVKASDEIDVPVELKDFGRISAQTAKQVIFQKIREAERAAVYNEFKDKVGKIVSGTITRKERGILFVNLGRTEGILPIKETLPTERLKVGDAIKALVKEVKTGPKGPEIVLSRTAPEFVAELFKMEVPEIEDNVVQIKRIAREPGERTKIAVVSTDPAVDPVGACVGMKGTRVQAIVRELKGERIDIIHWTDDPRLLIARALTPAVVDRVGVNEEDKTAMVVVTDDQLSQAIGRRGQNVKLAMKLTGWEIDIISESEFARLKQQEAEKVFRSEEE